MTSAIKTRAQLGKRVRGGISLGQIVRHQLHPIEHRIDLLGFGDVSGQVGPLHLDASGTEVVCGGEPTDP